MYSYVWTTISFTQPTSQIERRWQNADTCQAHGSFFSPTGKRGLKKRPQLASWSRKNAVDAFWCNDGGDRRVSNSGKSLPYSPSLLFPPQCSLQIVKKGRERGASEKKKAFEACAQEKKGTGKLTSSPGFFVSLLLLGFVFLFSGESGEGISWILETNGVPLPILIW